MDPTTRASTYERFRQHADVLARIGESLAAQRLHVVVTLPAALATDAAAAWGQDDTGPVPTDETPDERRARTDAATLALIGLAISDRGRATGTSVVVPLDAWSVGLALEAADARGLPTTPAKQTGDTTITLSRAEAIVLFDWLHRMDGEGRDVSDDAAEQTAAWNLAATLESVLVEPFESDYADIVTRAKQQLVGEEGTEPPHW